MPQCLPWQAKAKPAAKTAAKGEGSAVAGGEGEGAVPSVAFLETLGGLDDPFMAHHVGMRHYRNALLFFDAGE